MSTTGFESDCSDCFEPESRHNGNNDGGDHVVNGDQQQHQNQVPDNSYTMVKTYTYNRNGKTITVKRKWKVDGDKFAKRQQLDQWFENEANIDPQKSSVVSWMDYRNHHDLDISYEMFYKEYVQKYGQKYKDEDSLDANSRQFIKWFSEYNDPQMSSYSAFHLVRLYYALTEKVVSEEFVKAVMKI